MPPTLDSSITVGGNERKSYTASNTFIDRVEYASAKKLGEASVANANNMMQSPSIVSQPGTRMDSIYGDEMDDGSRGVRHGYGVQVWQDGAKYKGQW